MVDILREISKNHMNVVAASHVMTSLQQQQTGQAMLRPVHPIGLTRISGGRQSLKGIVLTYCIRVAWDWN
jgi:hypothetical protein